MAVALAVSVAFAYALTNGFHDAANAIAAIVATRGATPKQAIVLASICNLIGPLLLGAAVADTIAGIVQVQGAEELAVVGAALTSAVAWNVFTWRAGLPSSSGHALVGGLCGAAIAAGGLQAVQWGGMDGLKPVGVIGVVVWLVVSPVLGFVVGAIVELVLRTSTRRARGTIRGPIRAGQWLMSGALAVSHGANDAQKAVGIIAVVLVASGRQQHLVVPTWAELGCGAALTVGTAMGGWTIVRTIGRRIYRVRPLEGLSSQTGSTAVIFTASLLGAPVSTTHVVASSVIGTAAGRRRARRVHWGVVREMLTAWVTTIPATGVLAAVALPLWRWIT